MPIIHITAAFSNAVLVAILPHVSNFAEKLDLPIPQPITTSQIAHCNVSPWKDDVGGSVWLTNHYQFVFGSGYLRAFQSPTNWFNNQYDNWNDSEYFKRYLGKDNITTNEAVEFARRSFYKLGYQPKDFDISGPPTSFEGPVNTKKLGHFPFCRMEWDSPESKIQNLLGLDYSIQFDIDMQRKQIVGMDLSGRRFFRPNPKVSVVPDLETNYRNAGVIGGFAGLMNREPYVHMTPAYSNATLKATLPYIADFAKRLSLPRTQPLTTGRVLLFMPPLWFTNNGFDSVTMLTNHFWFRFQYGFVTEFGSPDNWFEEAATRTNWTYFDDKSCMTTNEAIEFARNSIRQLGYKPEEIHMNKPPSEFENALDAENRRYAYCQIDWNSPEDVQGTTNEYHLEFDINMQRKQIVGATLIGKEFMRPLPEIAAKPELESDYQKSIQGHMFARTNAPRFDTPPGEEKLR